MSHEVMDLVHQALQARSGDMLLLPWSSYRMPEVPRRLAGDSVSLLHRRPHLLEKSREALFQLVCPALDNNPIDSTEVGSRLVPPRVVEVAWGQTESTLDIGCAGTEAETCFLNEEHHLRHNSLKVILSGLGRDPETA